MENKNYNGFASEAQYLAVRKEVSDAVAIFREVEDEFEVYGNTEFCTIDIIFWGWLHITLCGGEIAEIEVGDIPFNMYEVEMIEAINDSVEDIYEAYYANEPKEEEVNA